MRFTVPMDRRLIQTLRILTHFKFAIYFFFVCALISCIRLTLKSKMCTTNAKFFFICEPNIKFHCFPCKINHHHHHHHNRTSHRKIVFLDHLPVGLPVVTSHHLYLFPCLHSCMSQTAVLGLLRRFHTINHLTFLFCTKFTVLSPRVYVVCSWMLGQGQPFEPPANSVPV